MAPKHLFQAPWPSFSLNGDIYDLSHLNEYRLSAFDSDNHPREILVVFSDHCFTEEHPDDPSITDELLYPQSTRKPGYFNRRRYQHSLLIVDHIEAAKIGTVWNVHGQNVAIIPKVKEGEKLFHYVIVFDLWPLKGLRPYVLKMEILSAYVCDDMSELTTFGSVGFKKLVTIALTGKKPRKNHSKHRKRPK